MKVRAPDHPIYQQIEKQLLDKYPKVDVCPLDQFENEFSFKKDSIEERRNTLFLTESLSSAQILEIICDLKCCHILQVNNDRFSNDFSAATRLINNYSQYFESNYNFIEGKIEDSLCLEFYEASSKVDTKTEIEQFVKHIQSPQIQSTADTIVEEFFMNSMLDAPREASKKGWSPELKSSEFYLAKNENSLQISCTDYFGSLEMRKLLERMNSVYKAGLGSSLQQSSAEGAGIGCVMTFESSMTMIVGVIPQQVTKFTCIVPIGLSNKKRELMNKSFHWFTLDQVAMDKVS